MDCSSNWSYFKYEELRCESVKIALMQLQLVLLKRSKDNVSLDWSAYITPSCDCFVIYLPPCYQASPKQVGRITKKKNSTRQVHQAGFLSPFSALLCAGNLVNMRSTQKLSWIPLVHVSGRRTPSFCVTGTTRFESDDIICQIWPIRGYTTSWYTGTGRSKKWLQALPSFLPFYFRVCAFSIQRTRISRSLEQTKTKG